MISPVNITKRKRTVLSLDQKREIIERLDKGERASKIAQEYGVGKSTITDIKNNRAALENYFATIHESTAYNRKTMKRASDEKLDTAVFLWYVQMRQKGSTITGPMILVKATSFHQQLYGPANEIFMPSSGWLKRFRERHAIKTLPVVGEQGTHDLWNMTHFVENLQKHIREKNIHPEQLYSIDKIGLFWQLTPDEIPSDSSTNDPALKYKDIKDRITLLVCANATGKHKLKLLCSGKYEKPTSLRGMAKTSLPVFYKQQRRAWLDREIIASWFHHTFVPSALNHALECGLESRLLLIFDRSNIGFYAPLRSMSLDAVDCLFLPLNTNSSMQPLEWGPAQILKNVYRKKIICSCLDKVTPNRNINEILKSVNLSESLFALDESWKEVSEACINQAWKRTVLIGMPNDSNIDDNITQPCGIQELGGDIIKKLNYPNISDLDEWIKFNSEPVEETYTDEQIVEMVNKNNDFNAPYRALSSDSEEDEKLPKPIKVPIVRPKPIPSTKEAITCLEKLIYWMENQQDADSSKLMKLHEILLFAKEKQTGVIQPQMQTNDEIENLVTYIPPSAVAHQGKRCYLESDPVFYSGKISPKSEPLSPDADGDSDSSSFSDNSKPSNTTFSSRSSIRMHVESEDQTNQYVDSDWNSEKNIKSEPMSPGFQKAN